MDVPSLDDLAERVRKAEAARTAKRTAAFKAATRQAAREHGLRGLRATEGGRGPEADASAEERQIAARTMRVFVSSTFTDMADERDAVAKSAGPELAAAAAEIGVDFSFVDLRWGITGEDSRSGRAIAACLAEVAACAPFFVGILGARYGWAQPDPAAEHDALLAATFDHAQNAYPWLAHYRSASVTELEVVAAALAAPSVAYNRAFFFFRANTPGSHPDHVQRDYVRAGAHSPTCRLIALKQRIRDSGLSVDLYSSPAQLAALVESRLAAAMRDAFDDHIGSYTPSPVHAHIPPVLGPDGGVADALASFIAAAPAASAPSAPLVVVGPPGAGKTLALRRALAAAPLASSTVVAAHFCTSRSTEHHVLSALMAAFAAAAPDLFAADILPTTPLHSTTEFPNWVARLSHAARPTIIIVDAPPPSSALLLGGRVPPFVRLIISAASPPPTPSPPTTLALPLWSPSEVASHAAAVLARVGKSLAPEQAALVAACAPAALPLFSTLLLEELKVYGAFDHLTSHLAMLTSLATPAALLSSIFARWADDFEGPARLPAHTVERTLAALSLSLGGLRESELMAIVGVDDRTAWRPFARALAAIVDVHADGRLSLVASLPLANAVDELWDALGPRRTDVAAAFVAAFETALAAPATRNNTPAVRRIAHELYAAFVHPRVDIPISPDILIHIPLLMAVYDGHGAPPPALLDVFAKFGAGSTRPAALALAAAADSYMADGGGAITRAMQAGALFRVGCLLSEMGHTARAAQLLNDAVEMAGRAYGARSERVGEILLAVAETGGKGAMDAVERAELVLAHAVGVRDVRRGLAACTRGLLLKKAGAYAQARDAYDAGLGILQAALGPHHPRVTAQLLALGDVLRKEARWDDANAVYTAVLDANERTFGARSLAVARTRKALGAVAKKQGRYDAALEHYAAAVEITHAALGADSVLGADLAVAVGDVERKLGNFHSAHAAYTAALNTRTVLLGADHEDVGETYMALGMVAKKTGAYDDAMATYAQASTALAAALGTRHPKMAVVAHNKGDALRKLKRYDAAAAEYSAALALNTELGMPDEVGWNHNGLGLVALATGRYADAESHLDKAAAIFADVFGDDHVKYAQVVNNQAILAKVRGDLPTARELYSRAMAINTAALGPRHLEVAENKANLAVVAALEGNVREARILLADAVGCAEAVFGVGSAGVKVDDWVARVASAGA